MTLTTDQPWRLPDGVSFCSRCKGSAGFPLGLAPTGNNPRLPISYFLRDRQLPRLLFLPTGHGEPQPPPTLPWTKPHIWGCVCVCGRGTAGATEAEGTQGKGRQVHTDEKIDGVGPNRGCSEPERPPGRSCEHRGERGRVREVGWGVGAHRHPGLVTDREEGEGRRRGASRP